MKILMRGNKNEKWELVQSASYAAESELQELLAETPSLVSINEVREGAGTLVAAVREFPLDIGYIDLVCFTASGDIAVIECKRAINSEIKREVIGQVFEYGANLWGLDYETVDEKVKLRTGKSLADLVREGVTDPNWDEEAFRANVRSALDIGNFILIIVVDEIRDELSRIVRFINDAGKPAFSLAALEMRKFLHGNVEMLIPHVFGATQKPKSTVTGEKFKWDEESFLEEMMRRHPEGVEPAKKILAWVEGCTEITRIYWGEGKKLGGFVPIMKYNGEDHQLFAIVTAGLLQVYFHWYKYRKPFDLDTKRKELLDRLNTIKGVAIPEDGINRQPSIPLGLLNDPIALETLLKTYEWFIQEIKSVK